MGTSEIWGLKFGVWSLKFQIKMAVIKHATFQSICHNKNNQTKIKMAAIKTIKTKPKYYCYLKSHNSCLVIFGLCPIVLVSLWIFNLIILCSFLRRYFSPSFYPINMKFGHDIPKVVRYTAVTFLSHPSCSCGFIQDSYTLERQKAVSAYL